MADDRLATTAHEESPEARQDAIAEILAEVQGGGDAPDDEPGAVPEGIDELDSGSENEEAPDAGLGRRQLGARPAEEPPDDARLGRAEAPRAAGSTGREEAVRARGGAAGIAAGVPWVLLAVHAGMLIVFSLGTWLTFRYVAGGMSTVAQALGKQGGGVAGAVPSAGAGSRERPPARPGEPVPEIDRGLRYTRMMDDGAQRFEKKQYEEAAAAYRGALLAVPPNWNDGAAAFRLGECYSRLGDHARAIQAYEQVETAYGTAFQARALCQRGEARLALKQYQKARAAFYTLLLTAERYGSEAGPWLERASYRVAECYWLEAESLRPTTGTRKGAPE